MDIATFTNDFIALVWTEDFGSVGSVVDPFSVNSETGRAQHTCAEAGLTHSVEIHSCISCLKSCMSKLGSS